jgi:hypothetical protein
MGGLVELFTVVDLILIKKINTQIFTDAAAFEARGNIALVELVILKKYSLFHENNQKAKSKNTNEMFSLSRCLFIFSMFRIVILFY